MADFARRQAVGLAVLAVVVAGSLLAGPDHLFAVARNLADRPVVFGALLVGVYLVRPLFAWPTTLVAILAGYAYGPVWGFPVALAGTTASALLPFLAARYVGAGSGTRTGRGSGLVSRLGDSGERFFDATGDLRGMVASRLAPAPSDPVSAAAGLSGVSPGAFVAGTALGEVPWTAAAVLAGSSLDHLSTAGLTAINWELLAAGGAVAVALLAGPAYRAVSARR
ncbi:VTT domain-containing protein [Halorussus gelatinilyticus]|uniref:VTT domain-containing protein n=1 Tax=Halorussus gelatinilyticus TaxID=2937524 RepID=A0A8U0ILN7_9EURY|nr:VTT domain-containing protein [Halorussus gelatinilyticus]UPW00949.1 VTT domain-containing protein [Halorussus gelatinilyticus]